MISCESSWFQDYIARIVPSMRRPVSVKYVFLFSFPVRMFLFFSSTYTFKLMELAEGPRCRVTSGALSSDKPSFVPGLSNDLKAVRV